MTLDAVNSAVSAVRTLGTAVYVISEILSLADPRVTIDQGPLRGAVIKSRGGIDILAFQGIPYAAPPVGNLRFRSPQSPPAWNDERLANVEEDRCLQEVLSSGLVIGQEDCLYLNVYTPKLTREGPGLSVMVWVHGGAFSSGSGDKDLYGPQFLLDRDVILVTFNYRLGALGFLSLGTSSAPGNYGLKDQVAALRWVQNNIAKFGGNPDRVTIFGESAGGASVHYLMQSPLARGLFHRAIVQSGSAFNPWAFDKEAPKVGNAAAVMLNCKQNDRQEVLQCLRKIDASRFLPVSKLLRRTFKRDLAFVPTLEPAGSEGSFLTEDPRVMLARGDISDVPLMAGLTTHEGMLQLAGLKLTGKSIVEDYYENQARFLMTAGVRPGTPEGALAWLDIERFYHNITKGDFTEQYILMFSDCGGVLGLDEFVRRYAALNRSPVFYYQFSYGGGLSLYKNIANINRSGTAHGDEIRYLFGTMVPLWLAAPEQDQNTINRVTKLWTDFAKTGHPTPPAGNQREDWRPVVIGPNFISTRYLDIGTNLVMKLENLNGQRIQFWSELREKYRSRAAY